MANFVDYEKVYPYKFPSMTETILSNIQLHQIEQEIEKISVACESLDPNDLGEAEKLARYEEILAHYEAVLSLSFKKARISESGLKLVV